MASELDEKTTAQDGAHSADDLMHQAVEKVHTSNATTPVAPSGAAGEQLYEAQVEGEKDSFDEARPAEDDVISIDDLSVDPESRMYSTDETPWERMLPIEDFEELDLADAAETEPEREKQEDLCRDARLFTDDINETYSFFKPTIDMFQRGKTEVGLTRRYSLKAIDEVWVTVIEDTLTALEYVVRHPSVYIEENEEIKPIEQSRHITQKSTRHLAQHTNFISKVEGDEVTPNKILNITRDETMLTYENRFVNTLLNRLFVFVDRRFRQAKSNGNDEIRTTLKMSSSFGNEKIKGTYTLNFELVRAVEDLAVDSDDGEKYNFSSELWHRVEKLESAVAGYAHSPFTKAMGNNFVRPPILHTNAINKNKYLRQCLALWEFIESYEGIGYEMLIRETAEKPDDEYIQQMYDMIGLQYFQFREEVLKMDEDQTETLAEEETPDPLKPKFLDKLRPYTSRDFDIQQSFYRRSVKLDQTGKRRGGRLAGDERKIDRSIRVALAAQKLKEQQREEEKRRQAEEARRLAEEAKRRAEEEEAARLAAEEAARIAAEEEAKRAAEEAARRAAEEEAARIAAEEEAHRQRMRDIADADRLQDEQEEARRKAMRSKIGHYGRKRKKKYQKIRAIELEKHPELADLPEDGVEYELPIRDTDETPIEAVESAPVSEPAPAAAEEPVAEAVEATEGASAEAKPEETSPETGTPVPDEAKAPETPAPETPKPAAPKTPEAPAPAEPPKEEKPEAPDDDDEDIYSRFTDTEELRLDYSSYDNTGSDDEDLGSNSR